MHRSPATRRHHVVTRLAIFGTLAGLFFVTAAVGETRTSLSSDDASARTNYVILTTARSSSTMLCREISDHRDAECYGELMSKGAARRYLDFAAGRLNEWPSNFKKLLSEGSLTHNHGLGRDVKGYRPETSFSDDELTPFTLVKWLLKNQLPHRAKLCHIGWHSEWCLTEEYRQHHKRLAKGFKVFYNHDNVTDILQLCKQLDLPVIHLVRASGFRRSISEFVAKRSGTHQKVKPSQLQKARKTAKENAAQVDISWLRSAVQKHVKNVRYWAKYLDDNGIRHMTIFYEELKMRKMYLPQKEVFRDVYEFLGLGPKRVRGKVPEVNYSKALNYTHVITNMAELRETFPFETCGLDYGSPVE